MVRQLNIIVSRLAENGINLEYTDKALDLLAKNGYEPEFGARPVKRLLQRDVLNVLSKFILAGDLSNTNDTILMDEKDGVIFFTKK